MAFLNMDETGRGSNLGGLLKHDYVHFSKVQGEMHLFFKGVFGHFGAQMGAFGAQMCRVASMV